MPEIDVFSEKKPNTFRYPLQMELIKLHYKLVEFEYECSWALRTIDSQNKTFKTIDSLKSVKSLKKEEQIQEHKNQ